MLVFTFTCSHTGQLIGNMFYSQLCFKPNFNSLVIGYKVDCEATLVACRFNERWFKDTD